MSIEVPVPEGDAARSLTQEELGQGQEDHYWFSHESTCATSVLPKDTKYVWFQDQAIWREEHKSEDGFEKTVEECEDPDAEQLEVVEEEMENVEVVIAILNGLPRSWINSCKEFVPEGSD